MGIRPIAIMDIAPKFNLDSHLFHQFHSESYKLPCSVRNIGQMQFPKIDLR